MCNLVKAKLQMPILFIKGNDISKLTWEVKSLKNKYNFSDTVSD